MAHWMQHIVEFGIGFFQGIAESRADRSSNKFVELAQGMSNSTGFAITDLRSNQATYSIPHGGQFYPLVVTFNGQGFLLQALSLIGFPRGRVPENVCEALVRCNRQMSQCDYDLHEGPHGSLFFVRAKIRLGSFVSLFEEAALELVNKIAALDAALVQCGYGN